MMNSRNLPAWFALLLLAAACDRPSTQLLQPTSAIRTETTGSTLIECPVDHTDSTSAMIGLLGGALSLDGTTVSIPAGALLLPATISLKIPAGNYMEVDVSVPGMEHFTFQQPITVSIDYSRCTRSDIDKTPLTAWYIDETTKALLEDMLGTDDKSTRHVTFTTGHLSGYAIAD